MIAIYYLVYYFVPHQRGVDHGAAAHRGLEELLDLARAVEGAPEVVVVGRVVGEDLRPGGPVLVNDAGHEVVAESLL